MPAVDPAHRPYWILFFAHIWGSLGVGASIFAVWILWIVPSFVAKPKVEEPWILVERPASQRRKIAEICTTPPSLSLPPSPAQLDSPLPQQPVSRRHVSFKVPPPIRLPSSSDAIEVSSLTASNTSSEATVYTPRFFSPVSSFEESQDIPVVSRHSRQLSQRILKAFVSKRKDSATSYDSEPETGTVRSKGTNSFWSKSRRSCTNEQGSNKPSKSPSQRRVSLPMSSRMPSPPPSAMRSSLKSPTPFSYFIRKSEPKRHSVPLPARRRTEPYGAPYFAVPPSSSPDMASISERPRTSTESVPVRGRQALRQHVKTPNARRPIVKRRSASTSRAMTSMEL